MSRRDTSNRMGSLDRPIQVRISSVIKLLKRLPEKKCGRLNRRYPGARNGAIVLDVNKLNVDRCSKRKITRFAE